MKNFRLNGSITAILLFNQVNKRECLQTVLLFSAAISDGIMGSVKNNKNK